MVFELRRHLKRQRRTNFFFFEMEEFLKNGYDYNYETFTNGLLAKKSVSESVVTRRLDKTETDQIFFSSQTRIWVRGVPLVLDIGR